MQSIRIKNYKNLRDFKIDSLSRVNLIVGKNNVGKSTLLEAIAIYAAGGEVNCLKEILDIRGEITKFSSSVENIADKEKDSFSSLYYGRDIDAFFHNSIEISTGKDKNLFGEEGVSIKMVRIVEIYELDDTGIESRNRRLLDADEETEFADSNAMIGILSTYGSKKSIYTFGNKTQALSIKRATPYEYVRTSQVSSTKNPYLFDRIALTSLEAEVIRALKIIEARISDINFLKDDSRDETRVPIVVFADSNQRYKLSSMGDGVNRILTIILALLNCKGGVLLIDEFENGLHHSVQTQLWQMIFKLAEQVDVQVFATTHSDDCIKGFAKANENQEGELIRLENRGDKIVAVKYNERDELDYIANNEIEIR